MDSYSNNLKLWRSSKLGEALIVILAIGFFPAVGFGQKSSTGPDQRKADLPRAVKKRLDQSILPALLNDQKQFFVTELADTINKLGQSNVELIEAYASKQGFATLKSSFAKSLIEQVESGAGDFSQLDAGFELSLFLGQGIKQHIENKLQSYEKFYVAADKVDLPEEWRARELLFWELHVLDNELANFKRLADFASSVVMKHHRIAERNQLDEKLELLEPILNMREQVKKTELRVYENTALYHLIQLEDAAETLENETDILTRLYAAYALQNDAAWLKDFLAKADVAELTDPRLKDSQAIELVKVWYQKGAAKGDDVLEKSVLLRVGVHWWFRGRYGRAHLLKGMLKLPAAVDSEEMMFSLFMPKERPKPICSYLGAEATSEGYDRRHFYTWDLEYRPLQTQSERKLISQESKASSEQKIHGHFW